MWIGFVYPLGEGYIITLVKDSELLSKILVDRSPLFPSFFHLHFMVFNPGFFQRVNFVMHEQVEIFFNFIESINMIIAKLIQKILLAKFNTEMKILSMNE